MRLIDADRLIDDICREDCGRVFKDCVMPDHCCSDVAKVQNQPTVRTERVKEGHWVENRNMGGFLYCSCSECGEVYTGSEVRARFCPWCGARMMSGAEQVFCPD